MRILLAAALLASIAARVECQSRSFERAAVSRSRPAATARDSTVRRIYYAEEGLLVGALTGAAFGVGATIDACNRQRRRGETSCLVNINLIPIAAALGSAIGSIIGAIIDDQVESNRRRKTWLELGRGLCALRPAARPSPD